jgi:3-hydroxy acid dehydrogenase/malonic semialdehyde reductase
MLKNETVLITGATAGFGEATARLLAKEWPKAKLWLTGRRKERLDALVSELGQERCQAFAFDIRDRKAVETFAKNNDLAQVSVLINNAGLAAGLDLFQEASIDDWEAMIDTNLKGLLYITRAVLPQMAAKERGHIVNLGSVAGRYTYPKGHVYNATKFAVHALGEALRLDVLGKNIRVTTIAPGMADTEFSKVRFAGDEKKAKAVYQGMEPLQAEDVAEAIFWCLDRPARINVQEIVLYPTAQASPRDVARKP